MSIAMLAAVILAAGKGSRLGALTEFVPKAGVWLPGGSLLDHHIIKFIGAGFQKIFVVCGYLEEEIAKILIDYPACEAVRQPGKLGTPADGLLAVEQVIQSDFIVVHGDHYFGYNPFPDLAGTHIQGEITFLVEHPGKYESFGYGLRCVWDPSTRKIRHWADEGEHPVGSEMIFVDGCMVLPNSIFSLIRDARSTVGATCDMREVFTHIMQRDLATARGVETKGWWANVNDPATLGKTMKRILHDRAKIRTIR